MRRRDQLAIQSILWLAVATFLFGIWAIVVGLRNPAPATPPAHGGITNGHSPGGSNN